MHLPPAPPCPGIRIIIYAQDWIRFVDNGGRLKRRIISERFWGAGNVLRPKKLRKLPETRPIEWAATPASRVNARRVVYVLSGKKLIKFDGVLTFSRPVRCGVIENMDWLR